MKLGVVIVVERDLYMRCVCECFVLLRDGEEVLIGEFLIFFELGIWMLDVVVKKRLNYFKDCLWILKDFIYVGYMVFMYGLCLLVLVIFFWDVLGVFFGLYVIMGLFGIMFFFYCNLLYKSFKFFKWLEYFFVYCGV